MRKSHSRFRSFRRRTARRLARVARVAIVGSYGVGLTVELDRVPEAGETVVGRRFRRDHGGKGSNQAVGAARLGAEVDFLTAIGDDAFGHGGVDALAEGGRARRSGARAAAPTMTAPIFVEPSGREPDRRSSPARSSTSRARTSTRSPTGSPRADVCLVQLEIPRRHGALRARGRAARRRAHDPQSGAGADASRSRPRSTT